MMLLVINTSTVQYSIALINTNGVVVGEYLAKPASRHYGAMFPSLDFLIRSVNCSVSQLSSVVVAVGPGSFTGLRVGISAALGLSHALDLPIIGINSLEALASQVYCHPLPVTSIIDSRRGEVFAAKFTWDDKYRLCRETDDLCLTYEELPSKLQGPTIVVGNNMEKQKGALKEIQWPQAKIAPPHLWNLRASAIGFLAADRFRAGKFDNPLTISPIYLRPPDIRPNPYFKGTREHERRPV